MRDISQRVCAGKDKNVSKEKATEELVGKKDKSDKSDKKDKKDKKNKKEKHAPPPGAVLITDLSSEGVLMGVDGAEDGEIMSIPIRTAVGVEPLVSSTVESKVHRVVGR